MISVDSSGTLPRVGSVGLGLILSVLVNSLAKVVGIVIRIKSDKAQYINNLDNVVVLYV